MRGVLIGVAAAALAGGAQAAELVLDDVVARVVVIPEARSDIQVQVQPGRALPAPRVDRSGSNIRISAGLDVERCSSRNNDCMRVRVKGRGEFDIADAPLITIRAPRSFALRKEGGAVTGRIGPTQDLTLAAGGCGHFALGDVAGTLDASLSGGAHASVGRVRAARLRASGGGAVEVQTTASLDADATGGGQVRVASVTGPVSADGSGGGGVKVDAGRTGLLRAGASGGGWVDFDGVADALDASASGGGRVSVARVTGRIDQRSSGGGSISIGR